MVLLLLHISVLMVVSPLSPPRETSKEGNSRRNAVNLSRFHWQGADEVLEKKINHAIHMPNKC